MKNQYISILTLVLVAGVLSGCADLKVARQARQSTDYTKARANLEDLQKRGFPEADTQLGEMYMNGQGVPVDQKKAVALFRHAITAQNYSVAMLDLGKAYRLGTGVPKDLKMARMWYDRAAATGDDRIWAEYGLMEQETGNYAAAEADFNKARASKGPEIWRYFGTLHVLMHKPERAIEDYKRGIAAGDPASVMLLGDLQAAQGHTAEAEATYKTALDAGDARAAYKIGALYKDKDGAKALVWFYRAQKLGMPGMDRKIEGMGKKLQPEDLAKALKLSEGDRK